jgi:hypothetical protein
MLHPIEPPTCMPELEILICLQQKLLDFAVINSTYSEADFRRAMGDDFVNWLIGFKSPGVKTPKIINRFFQELHAYVKCSAQEKAQILQDFVSDQNYYQMISDGSFSFSLLPQKSDAHAKASECLGEFYEFLGIGFPAILVGQPAGSPPFKKESVISGCKANNPNIEYVCPCCDNAFTDSATANEQGYTLEHYFPMSLYPSICLHPLNLVPMCSGCNARKKDIDPLNPSVAPLVRVAYEEVFHPIARPVRRHADLSFQSRPTVPDEMKFVSSNPPTYTNSIAAYKILYQIPDRWEANWKRVDKQVTSYLRRALRRLNSPLIDQPLFEVALQDAITELEDDVGQNHLCYPAVKWLSWARTNKMQDLMQSFVES